MTDSPAERAVAIVGLGAILPDATNVDAFWQNILGKRYSISEVPPDRWSVEKFYHPDPRVPDKTYSKIGGWVRGYEFDWKRFRIPPKVSEAMDQGQQWAVSVADAALAHAGFPNETFDTERTGVVLGTAMGGELHYITTLRVYFPDFAEALASVEAFGELPQAVQQEILTRWQERIGDRIPPITEDTMPGELPNIVSGRVANVLNLRGPNFITDAACASSFAAVEAAMELLAQKKVDAVITGGVDRNMGVSSFVKFCKIGALSSTGTRPFGRGADGFVMGEGAGAFVLKRLADAERDGDTIYAVIRGVAGSSDGKGKGITAPNPIGQRLAMERAWQHAGLDPATVTLIEAHGTSTKVGDVVEFESLSTVFGGAPKGSVALGSVKSNFGHLKAGAGAAGMLKSVLALYHKILPPTLNAQPTNPDIDLASSPFFLCHEAREWERTNGTPRRAGVSAYGFGGTNFHLVLEEYEPGRLTQRQPLVSGAALAADAQTAAPESGGSSGPSRPAPAPVRGILAIGAATTADLEARLDETVARVENGWTPPRELPGEAFVRSAERLVIDFENADELRQRLQKAKKAMGSESARAWAALQSQGVFRGSGPKPGKVAFLFPGQGSQYVNMGRELVENVPAVASVFEEADRIMTPILGRPLTDFIFVDDADPASEEAAQEALKQTAVTQPAMLTFDVAVLRLLSTYGFEPDMVMGHSLGEYAGLIAAGIMPFSHALEAAAARGSEMSKVEVEDPGKMAAVMASVEEVERVLAGVDGYVVPANINSLKQCVIGGETKAVEAAISAFAAEGIRAVELAVSHAFHTKIVASAGGPMRKVLDRMQIRPPSVPIIANVTGSYYPTDVEEIKDILQRQIASPVQWVTGLNTLYDSGVRVFVEVGPKRALQGFVREVFADRPEVQSFMTNLPRTGEQQSINHAICGLLAAGYGPQMAAPAWTAAAPAVDRATISSQTQAAPPASTEFSSPVSPAAAPSPGLSADELRAIIAETVSQLSLGRPLDRQEPYDAGLPPLGSVIITGAGLGLPGAEKLLMDPDNVKRILRGDQFVDLIPERFRKRMVNKEIVRIVKAADGTGSFETINNTSDVVKLAGRAGRFDLTEEYGVPDKVVEALDVTSRLAMAAGIDALREAGIPLVMTYRKTTTGKMLPDRWLLPEALRDETGVIFASAFPGLDRLVDEVTKFYEYHERMERLTELEELRRHTTDAASLEEINRRIGFVRDELNENPYAFDRRFMFRILCMGHSQFAEFIGARGPNTHVNAACASTTQAVGIAEDWIRSGRCRRVIVIAGDDPTTDTMVEWMGSAFLSLGAAATDDRVEDAALPFDRRRHGMIMGMGACALVVESEDAARERGYRGIAEVLSTEYRNSAYHGTRLNVDHIAGVMDDVVTTAERRFGLNRHAMAPHLVFMSHETYTPARGGSASAEVVALRNTFGDSADEIVVANTKGFTGHAMGVGVEDVIALKILEHGIVPPVPNFKEVDPELGVLNLSRGGRYPVQFALHLAAGFGSQIAFALTRRIAGGPDRIDDKPRYEAWLAAVSGYDRADLEVVKRTLRVVDQGAPDRAFALSGWRRGTGPTQRVAESGTGFQAPPPRPVTATAPRLAPVAPRIESPAPPASVIAPPAAPPLPPPAPVTPAAPVAPAAAQGSSVSQRVMEIVAGQTGYPVDMLEMDLDLEADLGIDTVKQAETFSAIREAFDIPFQENLALRDYPTLKHVVGFVHEFRPDLAAAAAPVAAAPAAVGLSPAPAAAAPTPAGTAAGSVAQRVMEIVAGQTGYPVDMLEMDLDLEADLGIDTVKQAETFSAIREAFDIPFQENLALRDYPTLKHVVGFVHEFRPDLAAAAAPVAAAPAAVVSAPAPSLVPPSPAAPAEGSVAQRVMEIVAGQTGYPVDMLEMDLDLEADLGIDTVKQAETFSAIREAFDIPFQENLALRDYPTLKHVVGFVHEFRPDLAAAATPSAPPAASVVSAPVPAPVASAQGGPAEGSVAQRVMEIVAGQTGYPVDMLEMDLDLEADLGIDTVKQAETFSAIREAFDIPFQESLALRDYPTLKHVVGFVHQFRPDLAAASAPAVAPAGAAPAAATPSPSSETAASSQAFDLEHADRFPRRVVVPVVRPELALCKETAVRLEAGLRVVVALDAGGVGRALVTRLEKRGVSMLVLDPSLDLESVAKQVDKWLAEGPIAGVFWLTALDVEPGIEELSFEAWKAETHRRVKALYQTMRRLYASVSTPDTFLVAGTRLGGSHGYDRDGAVAPLGGAVSGFCKAYKRERPDALVKVVDFAPGRKTAQPADALLAEALRDPSIVEVGYVDDRRLGVAFVERPLPKTEDGLKLSAESVFLVTGAAGGITSAIVDDLARSSGGVFYLLDLTPAPDAADPHIVTFREGRDKLKNLLIEEARTAGERITPVQIERSLLDIERREAALRTVESVARHGGTAHYRKVNLLDHEAVDRVVEEIRKDHGRIDVLVHAGGLEISRDLDAKETREFNLVFDVKADGYFSLLSAAKGLPIGASVVFSSVAGRFGNNGQTDYSAANDLLCKISSSFRRWRPDTRGIALDWTAWGGIGMATRGSIPKIMEMAGIEMLPPASGVPTVRREVVRSAFSGEIVVGGTLGMLVKEWDPDGGMEFGQMSSRIEEGKPGIMSGEATALSLYSGLEIRSELDPKVQPFLFDHQIDGTPVLPGVMGLEAFTQAAELAASGYQVTAIEDVRYLAPFKFYRSEPQSVYVQVQVLRPGDGSLEAEARLLSRRALRKGDLPAQEKVHFTAKLTLAPARPDGGSADKKRLGGKVDIGKEAIYQVYFHGPAYQVLAGAAVAEDGARGAMDTGLPADTAPPDGAPRAVPRLVELAFQTAGVWELRTMKRMALPAAIDRVEFFKRSEKPLKGAVALVKAVDQGAAFDVEVFAEDGKRVATLKGYRTVPIGANVTL